MRCLPSLEIWCLPLKRRFLRSWERSGRILNTASVSQSVRRRQYNRPDAVCRRSTLVGAELWQNHEGRADSRGDDLQDFVVLLENGSNRLEMQAFEGAPTRTP